MKLMRVLNEVHCKPWLIREDVHCRIAEIVQMHVAGDTERINAAVKALGLIETDEPEPLESQNIDGISIIPIRGVIGRRVGMLEKTSGVTDIEEISALLDVSMADTAVRGIILDIDSPGGTVAGVMELAENIRFSRKDKPIWAFTSGDMDSAAYWIGSAASHISATPSASVGSIGVYLPWMDQTKRYEIAGVKVDVIKAGRLKGMGVPGTALNEEQRAYLQSQVDYLRDQFKGAVIDGRERMIDDETMQGQAFYAAQALERGLIDDICGTMHELIDAINRIA
jgi:signal peptide peptidase SppA